jgi:hypothetical protein
MTPVGLEATEDQQEVTAWHGGEHGLIRLTGGPEVAPVGCQEAG